jgi:Tfp pilus assembly protein PilN
MMPRLAPSLQRSGRGDAATDDDTSTGSLSTVESAEPVSEASQPSRGDSQGTDRVDWAVVPRVNLLPLELLDARRFRRVQVGLGVGILCVAGLLGAGTVWAQGRTSAAADTLAQTHNETLALQQQQLRYAEVPKVKAELEASRTARERALGADVLWYRFLTDLAVNTPEGTVLSSVTIATNGTTIETAATGPLTPAGLGTVTVEGEANRFVDVAAWLDAAGRVNGLTGTKLSAATRSVGVSGAAAKITYSGTAVITSAALSHRYDRKAG